MLIKFQRIVLIYLEEALVIYLIYNFADSSIYAGYSHGTVDSMNTPHEMGLFESHYYEINRKLLCLVGTWPFQNSTDRILRKCVILSFMLTAMTAQISSIFTSGYNLNVIIESVAIETVVCIIYIKYANYSIYYNEIKNLTQDLMYSWDLIQSKEEIYLFRQIANEGRTYILRSSLLMTSFLFVMIAIASTWTYILNIVSSTNTTKHGELFVSLEYFVDAEKYFPILFLHVNIAIFCGLLVLIATDAMFMTFVYHACGLFQICGYQLEHIYDKEADIFRSMDANKRIQQKIARSVEFHIRAIRYTQNIADAYSWSCFVQVFLIVGDISITLYYLSSHMDQLRDAIFHSMYVICQMTQLLMFVYPAQKLVDLSTEILDKTYNGKWYTVQSASQKLCVLPMLRCLTPCTISVGKIFVCTLKQCASIIQTAVSYFTVLYSLQI